MKGDLISVYVSDIHQEFLPKEAPARGWNDFNWNDQWRSDWRRDAPIPGRNPIPRFAGFEHLLVRNEESGGLVYNPVSQTVFQLNETAVRIVLFLQTGARKELGDGHDPQSMLRDAVSIVSFLAGYGVTPTSVELDRISSIGSPE